MIGAYIATIAGVIAITLAVKSAGAAIPNGVSGYAAFGLVVGLICVWLYGWVRLSLAPILTFDRGKIDLFGSWRLTRGQFWPMLGTYLIVFVFMMVVGLLLVLIMLALAGVAGGGLGGVRQAMSPDLSSLQAFLTPAGIARILVGGVSSAITYPLFLVPGAFIYRTLRGD